MAGLVVFLTAGAEGHSSFSPTKGWKICTGSCVLKAVLEAAKKHGESREQGQV